MKTNVFWLMLYPNGWQCECSRSKSVILNSADNYKRLHGIDLRVMRVKESPPKPKMSSRKR